MQEVPIDYYRFEGGGVGLRSGLRWVVVLATLIWSAFSGAVTLGFGPITVEDTSYVLPVFLSDMESPVSALNFSLAYDPNVFQPVHIDPGPIAQAANKIVGANITGPGIYTVLVYGVNDTVIPAGDLGWISMERISLEPSGLSGISIMEAKAVSPDEQELPVLGDVVQVAWGDADAPDPEDEEDEDDLDSPEESEEEEPADTADSEDTLGTSGTSQDTASGTTVNLGSGLGGLNLPSEPMVIPRTARNSEATGAGPTGTALSPSDRRGLLNSSRSIGGVSGNSSNNITVSSPESGGAGKAQAATGGSSTVVPQRGAETIELKNPGVSRVDDAQGAQSTDASTSSSRDVSLDFPSLLIGGIGSVFVVGLIVFLRKKLIKD